jgi:lipopolysaccharide/colanic/teichoic acid biosynthesis glycosyltransferase
MQYDIQYVNDHSFSGDLKILWRTVTVVLSRQGAR